MAEPTLSIIILQWNHHGYTADCVDSVRAHSVLPNEIIVVDNGSDEASAEWASSNADVPVLLEQNRGFAAGMNAGLAVATGTYVAFVNNDTILPDRWDEMLVSTLDEEGAAIVAPVVSAAGNQSTVRSGPGIGTRSARPFVDLPSGVVYVMNSSLIREIGGWREEYRVASSEDLDLLFTVWSVGMEVVIDDRVFVQHVGSATASKELPNKGAIWKRNRMQLVDTWSSMDEESFRSRYAWVGPVSVERLESARVAAYWMRRYFEASDERSRLNAEHGRSSDSSAEPATPSAARGLFRRRR